MSVKEFIKTKNGKATVAVGSVIGVVVIYLITAFIFSWMPFSESLQQSYKEIKTVHNSDLFKEVQLMVDNDENFKDSKKEVLKNKINLLYKEIRDKVVPKLSKIIDEKNKPTEDAKKAKFENAKTAQKTIKDATEKDINDVKSDKAKDKFASITKALGEFENDIKEALNLKDEQ